MLAQFLVLLIRVYQWTLSPLLGNVCRFEPSCSNYTIQCLRTHGPFLGIWLGFRRVLRCHPFNPGGYDPPPPRTPRGPSEVSSGGQPCQTEHHHRVSADEPRLTQRLEVC